jgi:hypothetical protein
VNVVTLSRPVPRQHLHTREIRCRGFRRDDGLWDIEGTLEDTKTYSFANHDRGGIAAGEPVHRMLIRLTVDDGLVVRDIEVATAAGPFAICGAIAPAFSALKGLTLGPGWRRAVLQQLGGVHGCTHLVDLLLGPLTTTTLQTVAAARARREGADGARPVLIDSCHALSASGPVVQRQWPAFHRAAPGAGEDPR